MVGDGVNDSPALARAEVGIAIGAGTDVAVESAGVVLAGNDPRAVLSMVDLSRASYRKMIQNLAGYNIIAVLLAAGALAFAGVAISPAVAAILMSVSTIVVALNAQLLRRLRLDPTTIHQPGTLDPERPGRLEGRQSSERRETWTSANRCVATLRLSSGYRPSLGWSCSSWA